MNLADLALHLRATTADLKLANDIADLEAQLCQANDKHALWCRRSRDEEFLKGPADPSNWRWRIARARVQEWAWKAQHTSCCMARLRNGTQ